MGDIILERWFTCPYKIGQIVTSPIDDIGIHIEFFGMGRVVAIEKHGDWGHVGDEIHYCIHIRVNADDQWHRCAACDGLVALWEPHHCEGGQDEGAVVRE